MLEKDPHSVKALYRRAMAYVGKGTALELELAVHDLKQASTLAPDDVQVSSSDNLATDPGHAGAKSVPYAE